MTPAQWTDPAQRRAIPVQDRLDEFWANTGNFLMNQDQVQNTSTAMIPIQPDVTPSQPGPQQQWHGRSRTNTMTSTMSFYEALTPESSVGDVSRPASRPASRHMRDEGMPLSPGRKESTAKTLLSKGSRMLRRQGSKFNLVSISNPEGQRFEKNQLEASFSSDSLTKHHSRKSSAVDTKRDMFKRTISDPFDFKHVTHTDRGHLRNLQHVNRNELVSEFSAIRAGQRARPELQGIPVDDLPSLRPAPEIEQDRPKTSPSSPTATIVPSLPLTPPRPQPPPKDVTKPSPSPTPTPINIRLSKSFDNFSRPVPRSPLSPVSPITPPYRRSSLAPISPGSLSTRQNSPSVPTENPNRQYFERRTTVYSLDAPEKHKPLPCLPPVHAVSTSDDTARPLRTVPLPKIPANLADVPEEEESTPISVGRHSRKHSRSMSLRHAQTFPSEKDVQNLRTSFRESRANAVSSTDLGTVSKQNQALPGHAVVTSIKSHRVSMGVRAVEMQAWEDAIDYSWDHDIEAGSDLEWNHADKNSDDCKLTTLNADPRWEPQAELLSPTIERAFDELALISAQRVSPRTAKDDVSKPDTGLLMISPTRLPASISRPETPPLTNPNNSGETSPLFGLGIEAPHIVTLEPEDTSWRREEGSWSRKRKTNASSRSAGSGISKSSSQESIILSIASSIMSTHRSSNSSVSLSDFTPSMTSLKETEMESLPETPLEQYPETNAYSFPTVVAHATASQKGFAAASPTRPTQHQPYVLPMSADHRRTKSQATILAIRDISQPPSPAKPSTTNASSNTSPQFSPSHSRTNSGSRIPIPARTSSIAGPLEPKRPQGPYRKRSATTSSSTSRPKNGSRSSYSLFPGATPPTAV